MKKIFLQAATACCLLLAFSSCKKDETQAVLNSSVSPQLTASATTATITAATASATAVTYTWTPGDFGYQAAATYTLQFARSGTGFATTQDYNAGNALTRTFTVGELNGVYNALNCNVTSVSTPLDVRVKVTIGDKAPMFFSAAKSITATPYQSQTPPADSWAIIGSATANGWNTETRMTYDYCNLVWKITLPLTAGATDKFKFRANNAWTLNYGDDGADGKLEPNGADIAAPSAGNYTVTLNLNATPKPTYTLTRIP